MNYTQAYKTLRSHGIPADDARSLLDKAELIAQAKLEGIIVAFDGCEGFTVRKLEGEQHDTP